ncbi:hypothetical protein DSL72_004208 [Monilinia vaccinii-corymbosi]|uniref:Something about silencing protein 4 domain-containing protein n=1 Tax=Monilinia vaccinii-corymbosi TaxID=61207 RepID=A0A8A3P448_9HELO|nr:hypothetical protein DSL72_004208 [Monilinia vaccinii-corymbosi]
MSSYTRSLRKPEALTTSSGNPVALSPPSVNHNFGAHNHPSNMNGRKRARESADSDDHLLPRKKTKLAIEIPPKIKSLPPRKRSGAIKSNANPDNTSANSVQQLDAQTENPPPQNQQQQQKPKRHHHKVANGLQHELEGLHDRLQVKSDLKDERRKLRSQEGTKFKSELSAYFPEYDEVIGNVPKEEQFLDADTPIVIIDSSKNPCENSRTSKKEQNSEYTVKDYPSSLFTNLHGTSRVDFLAFTPVVCNGDPLSEEHFKTLHKRPERQEKAVRNADKNRAQHERDSVIRLMEGLQGPDWLKTLGVSGITEGRKKEFDSARQYFIKGCESILEKFRIWKDDEKQRKLKKERALAEAQAKAEAESEDDEELESDLESNGDPPDLSISDIDASAARQLHDEAIASSTPRRGARTSSVVTTAPTVEREFKSFFAKPYLRDAALGKHRRSGRSVAAWGHPVPDLPAEGEVDFDLPEEYRDVETLRAHARKKRRDRRLIRD